MSNYRMKLETLRGSGKSLLIVSLLTWTCLKGTVRHGLQVWTLKGQKFHRRVCTWGRTLNGGGLYLLPACNAILERTITHHKQPETFSASAEHMPVWRSYGALFWSYCTPCSWSTLICLGQNLSCTALNMLWLNWDLCDQKDSSTWSAVRAAHLNTSNAYRKSKTIQNLGTRTYPKQRAEALYVPPWKVVEQALKGAVMGCKSWQVRLTQFAVRCAETQTGPKNLGEELPEPLYMGSPLLLSDHVWSF